MILLWRRIDGYLDGQGGGARGVRGVGRIRNGVLSIVELLSQS